MPRVTITAPESSSQPYRFQMDREVVRLGRGSDNDIVIDSGSVSTNHAEMRRVIGGYELHDIGSTNGLKLDGVRYPYVALYHGSTVQLGDVAFDFSLTDEEQEVLFSEASPAPVADVQIPPPNIPVSTQPIGHVVQPRPVPRRQVVRVEQDSGGGFFMTLLLIIFAVLAFAAGVMVRHQKETGGSLIEHIKAKQAGNPVTAPAEPETPAPAAPTAPAPPPPVAPPLPQGDSSLPAQ